MHWTQPKQLIELETFYEKAREFPELFLDEEFLVNINKAFWPTNCWSYVEASFAIIAPGCLMRPHLTEALIRHPIEAMIAGGLENSKDVIAEGVALAHKEDAYVIPSDDGKQWLLHEWPKNEEMVVKIFTEVWEELDCE